MASDEVIGMSEVKVDLLKIALAIQLAFLGIFLSNQLGFELLILRQFIGSLYLFLVPGTLLALILKLNKAELSDLLLYSIDLCPSSIKVLRLALNSIESHIGIELVSKLRADYSMLLLLSNYEGMEFRELTDKQ